MKTIDSTWVFSKACEPQRNNRKYSDKSDDFLTLILLLRPCIINANGYCLFSLFTSGFRKKNRFSIVFFLCIHTNIFFYLNCVCSHSFKFVNNHFIWVIKSQFYVPVYTSQTAYSLKTIISFSIREKWSRGHVHNTPLKISVLSLWPR